MSSLKKDLIFHVPQYSDFCKKEEDLHFLIFTELSVGFLIPLCAPAKGCMYHITAEKMLALQ